MAMILKRDIIEDIQTNGKETWLENHSVYTSLEENQTNEV